MRETLLLLRQHAKVAAYLPGGSLAAQPVWAAVHDAPLPAALGELLSHFSYVLHQRDAAYVLYLLPDARYPATATAAAVLPLQPAVVLHASKRRVQQLEEVRRLADCSDADALAKLAGIAKGSEPDASLEARIQAVMQLTQCLFSAAGPAAAIDVRTALVETSNSDSKDVRAVAQDALLEYELRASAQ